VKRRVLVHRTTPSGPTITSWLSRPPFTCRLYCSQAGCATHSRRGGVELAHTEEGGIISALVRAWCPSPCWLIGRSRICATRHRKLSVVVFFSDEVRIIPTSSCLMLAFMEIWSAHKKRDACHVPSLVPWIDLSLIYTTSISKLLSSLTFWFMFNHLFYLKYLFKYIKL
jgi:hypothetical protein